MRRPGFSVARAEDFAGIDSSCVAQIAYFSQAREPRLVEDSRVELQERCNGTRARALNLPQQGERVLRTMQAPLQAQRGLAAIAIVPQGNLFRTNVGALCGVPGR